LLKSRSCALASDPLIVVANSTKYGGAGGSVSVNSVHPSGPAIPVHEVGHSFAALADEYESAGAIYSGSHRSQANVDSLSATPKWGHWIEPGTPLPTPDTSAYSSTVGAFEGARNHEFANYTQSRFGIGKACEAILERKRGRADAEATRHSYVDVMWAKDLSPILFNGKPRRLVSVHCSGMEAVNSSLLSKLRCWWTLQID
jgi:hypothetical protein